MTVCDEATPTALSDRASRTERFAADRADRYRVCHAAWAAAELLSTTPRGLVVAQAFSRRADLSGDHAVRLSCTLSAEPRLPGTRVGLSWQHPAHSASVSPRTGVQRPVVTIHMIMQRPERRRTGWL